MRVAQVVVAGLAATVLSASLVDWHVPLPPVALGVEAICADTIQRSPPDLSWSPRDIKAKLSAIPVSLAALSAHEGDLVRVAGVLHVEFEWVAL